MIHSPFNLQKLFHLGTGKDFLDQIDLLSRCSTRAMRMRRA